MLTNHREDDVSRTMYKETLRPGLRTALVLTQNAIIVSGKGVSKVNKICDAFLSVLQQRKSTNLQNIITAHVCKSPPDLEAGLNEVAKLQSMNYTSSVVAVSC